MTRRRQTGIQPPTPPPIQATDRRASQRISVQFTVRFSATDSFQHVGHGMALDLSESGCKLTSPQILPLGSFWDLYLNIPEASRPVLISEVRVIWAVHDKYGIEFLRIAARERTRLRHFLWKQMTCSTLAGGPPLFTLLDHSGPQPPHLKSLP